MPERWRSKAARKLVADIRAAGGTVERVGTGRLKVAGPTGSAVIYEPADDTRKDLARDSAARLLAERTGLHL